MNDLMQATGPTLQVALEARERGQMGEQIATA
jgi:hypothetical protein